MVNAVQFINGLVKYIDKEILAKISGWQGMLLGVMTGIAAGKAGVIFDNIAAHPVVKMLGIVDDKGMVDLDLLHKEFAKQAAKGPVTIDLPMVGAMIVNQTDVEKLYNYIKESAAT